ncbi:ROK family transcriptional regulator [Oceanobacillus halophilus]|uniref:ROK family transcriptional regulator n=1 Tax=Oceanobacillus halophilus TaxID=930130 RepID=A0A494ZYP8_9BACI|nr:ROK family transcriptional regulator [Oceanobacillus halophilus]RKQ30225.1 ROK family transcriptional regulator [Oceanobacillus halophilus]
MQRGSFQLMKSVNKSIVLNKIRTSEPISRAQIAKESRLTPPTVSSIVKELLEEGLVRESKLGESNGGRKPTMLHINSEAYYVIGVDAGPGSVECVLTDLAGKILARSASYPLTKPITNEQFLSILIECIESIMDLVEGISEKIIGIGIAMHGVIEVETGTSLVAPNLDLKDIPIKDTLEDAFDLTVKVENDARAMALGESWFGGNSDVDNMVAVNFGTGVGAGVVMNGKLYHGAQDIAGEFGHMTIDLHGEKCECGNPGCLQTFVSGEAIAERFKKQANLKDGLAGEKIYEMAKAENKDAVRFLQQTGEIIGIGLTNIIHLFNPSRIVLGGGVMKSQEFMYPKICQTIEERALTSEAKKTEVRVSSLGDDATLLGAVSLLLVELFDQQSVSV